MGFKIPKVHLSQWEWQTQQPGFKKLARKVLLRPAQTTRFWKRIGTVCVLWVYKKRFRPWSWNPKDASHTRDTEVTVWHYQNTTQEIIAINEDKLRLILKDYEDGIKVNTDWQTPLGLFVTILTTLLTADFHDFLGLAKAVWQAIFVLVLVFSLYLLITRICKYIIRKI